MNRSDVQLARDEAVRFIERADSLLSSEVQRWRWDGGKTTTSTVTTELWRSTDQGPSKEAAAVRRASLDLSSALARMRRRS